MLVLGVIAAVSSGENPFVFGLSGLLILFGIIVAIVAEIARWIQSHGIFRPQKTYEGMSYTQPGEIVRSNSERAIADYSRNSIRYVYVHCHFDEVSVLGVSPWVVTCSCG